MPRKPAKVLDAEPVLEAVPELATEPRHLTAVHPTPPPAYYKAWPGGRAEEVCPEGLRCLDDADVVNRLFVGAVRGSAKTHRDCLQEIRDMENKNRVLQMRAVAMSGEIDKRVASIIADFNTRPSALEEEGEEENDNGRRAGDLIRQLQDTSQQRAEGIMHVDRWHSDNAHLGSDYGREVDEPEVLVFLKEELARINEQRARPQAEEEGEEPPEPQEPLRSEKVEGLDMTEPANWHGSGQWDRMMSGK